MSKRKWTPSLRGYMRHMPQVRPLTREREAVLWSRIAAGDESAKEEVLLAIAPFVATMIIDFKMDGDHADLMQVGLVAALGRIESYNPNNGNSFVAYAYRWIKQAMMNPEGMAKRIAVVDWPAEDVRGFGKDNCLIVREDADLNLMAADLRNAVEWLRHEAPVAYTAISAELSHPGMHYTDLCQLVGMKPSTFNMARYRGMAKIRKKFPHLAQYIGGN